MGSNILVLKVLQVIIQHSSAKCFDASNMQIIFKLGLILWQGRYDENSVSMFHE
jgi:hypothetical protein